MLVSASGAPRRSPTQAILSSSTTSAASVSRPSGERSPTAGSLVTSSPTPVISTLVIDVHSLRTLIARHNVVSTILHQLVDRGGQLGRDVGNRVMPPAGHDPNAAADHVGDVRGRRGEDEALDVS